MKTLERARSYGSLKECFRVARVESWFGWIFSFSFGSIFLGLPALWHVILALFAFSSATASIFILNQYFDWEEDRENAIKSDLPVASGKMMPRTALILSLSLITSCLFLASSVGVSLLLLFLVYLALGIAYSAPPFRFKSVPIADFVVSGVCAGLLPFLIGASTSYSSNISISLILLSGIPLMLAHSTGHILQALGDYEADQKTGIQTFAVKYGRREAIFAVGFLSLITGLSPFIYVALGLWHSSQVLLLFLPLPFCILIAKDYIAIVKNPSTENGVNLKKAARKYGTILMIVVGVYVLVGKTLGL